ncbi:hypothetical protein PLICRDRAFT_106618 [Plicaturopsis crispa FD-325 SS-3]|nr:hypothetical protein PLICRDRAFT_106618 [Plicaturopsis crispa FD-325 SS-3]
MDARTRTRLSANHPLTFPYKVFQGTPIKADIYGPTLNSPRQFDSDGIPRVPSLVYFHGGGLTVGNRESWFPKWLQTRVSAAGYAFISADYRLMPPSTGHDILSDIQDLVSFLAHQANGLLDNTFKNMELDSSSDCGWPFRLLPDAIAVAGTSAGGLCAYLAAMHAMPRPKALLCMYGMGGDFLTHHYLEPKTIPFFRGRELLDSESFSDYIQPSASSLPCIAESALEYHLLSSPTPGYPANPRMLLTRLYLQLGTLLDVYAGEQGLSALVRSALRRHSPVDALSAEEIRRVIPERHWKLFPQMNVDSNWPPTYLLHGSNDTAVPIHESQNMRVLLEKASVPVHLSCVHGGEHSFDYQDNAEGRFGPEFDSTLNFLKSFLDQTAQ